jgi:hypothetical protein
MEEQIVNPTFNACPGQLKLKTTAATALGRGKINGKRI